MHHGIPGISRGFSEPLRRSNTLKDEEKRDETFSETGVAGDERSLDLEREFKKKEEECKLLNDRYLRALADMDNLRKRMTRDQSEALKYAHEKLFIDVIPVVDNLERAVLHAGEKKDFDALIEGLNLTLKEFLGVLEKFGVQPLESVGKSFDPALHHAVSQVLSETVDEGVVVEELRRGYVYNDRTIRPALVSVSKKAANRGSGTTEQ
jgi:molecular chaperone GrpE